MKPLLIFLVIAIFAIQTTVTQTTGKSKTSNVNEVPFYVMVLMVFIFFLLSCLISGLLYICMLCIEQYRENSFVENPEEQSSMEMFTPIRFQIHRPIPNPSFNRIHPV